MSDTQLHQDLGRLQGELLSMKERVTVMERQLADVHAVVMKAQGSWRALVVVGSISAAVGAGMAKLLGMAAALFGAGR